jgi:hypothetical protein
MNEAANSDLTVALSPDFPETAIDTLTLKPVE